jgi:tetratricopeptide (TPR) repeat protein
MQNDDFNMDDSQSEDFLSELLSRFEQMMQNKQPAFFDADELVELIDYYIMTAQLQYAQKALDIAMNQYPGNTDVSVYFARYLHATEQSDKAIRSLKDLLKEQPDNVEILISLGEILSDAGKQTEAVGYLDTALRFVDDEEKPMVLQQIVDALDEVGQHHKMISYLKKLIDIQPGNSEALSELAYCYNILNREEEGIVLFMKMADNDPFNAYAWFNLGTLYSGLALFEKAIEAFEYVLAIEPRFTSAAIKMGTALAALERIDSAIEVYQSVLQYEKKDASIYCYLGYCYSQNKDHKNAIHMFHKAISLDGEMTEAHLGLVYSYAGVDLFEASYRHMLRVLKDYDETDDLWLYKAYLEEQMDRHDDAIASYRKALEMNPSDINAWMTLAVLQTEHTKSADDAVSTLTLALDANPGSVELLYRIAAVCFEAGMDKEGTIHLHNALVADRKKTELMFLYNPVLENNTTINRIIQQYF